MIPQVKVPACILASSITLLMTACGGSSGGSSQPAPPPPQQSLFTDVTSTHVPAHVVPQPCMDVQAIDIDRDGDLDLALAMEFRSVVLLQNDGSGRFTDISGIAGVLDNANDHEDLAFADIDADDDLDFVVAAEDTMVHELYVNQGGVFVGRLLPETSVANAVAVFDFDHDNDNDIIFAGNGLLILENDGDGNFMSYSGDRVPAVTGIQQDVVIVDIDDDDDMDIAIAVEGQNRIFLNDGLGHYTDVTDSRLSAIQDESRVVLFSDVNNDGKKDLFVGNVLQEMSGVNPGNVIYLNDGAARFVAPSTSAVGFGTYGATFVDFDEDGDNDLLTASANLIEPSNTAGFRLFRNNGGSFGDITSEAFGGNLSEHGFSVAAGDFNRDGKVDFYLCSRGASQNGARVGFNDHLMLRR